MSIVERRLHDWKEILTILELNWTQRLEQDKIEHLSSYAHVVCTTGKQVISRRRKNEDVFTMSKDEKCTCKACKNPVFHCQICKFVGVLLPSSSWLLKLPSLAPREELIVFAYQIWKPQFLSVVQFPFDNCHSLFSPTTFFEIGVFSRQKFFPELSSAVAPKLNLVDFGSGRVVRRFDRT